MRFPGFIGPSYQLSSVNVDCQRTVNLYPELDEVGSAAEREIAFLRFTPGLRLLANFSAHGTRGTWVAKNGEFYVVQWNKLYKVSASWVKTELGTLDTTSGRVSIADNGHQLVVVDGPNGYVWDFGASTFVKIVNAAWLGADFVIQKDGYFIFNVPDGDQFYISGLLEVTFDALDISPHLVNLKKIISMVSDHDNIWFFGQNATEVFFNSGNADFPFERIQGAFVQIGSAAKFAPAKLNGTVVWVGGDEFGRGVVYQAQGFQPVRISTTPIEDAIQGYGDISNATSYTYQMNGHYFFVLTFPTASKTWVFDASTKLWHERAFLNQGNLKRHRSECHAFAFNTHVVGDWENGNLYELSNDTKSDNGAEIPRIRAAPHIGEDGKLFTHHSFEVELEGGTGLDGIGQGTDPKIMLRWSNDDGHTWSNELWRDIGKIGHTKNRAIWRRLGTARSRVYELTITDPVPSAIRGANIEVEKGIS